MANKSYSIPGGGDAMGMLIQLADLTYVKAVRVLGDAPVVTATYARPADNTDYSIGDIIGNSGTAASVVPVSFASSARATGGTGRITGARCVVSAASGTIVLPAFDLLLFNPITSVPFAAAGYPADNAPLTISIAAFKQCLGVLQFSATAWRNPAGGTTAAGDSIFQTAGFANRPYVPFNLAAAAGSTLVGLLQAQNTWAPTGIVNTFDFVLDIEQD